MGTFTFPPKVAQNAASLWSAAIQTYGRSVVFRANDGSADLECKAFCKRPKILGLFDRTEQSYDQTRYMVLVRAEDMPPTIEKFDRVRWDGQDHAVISTTDVTLGDSTFGYRVLVKG